MEVHSTPLKINMEHNSEGLDDGFPFQIGDFQVQDNFPGCKGMVSIDLISFVS